MAVSIKSAKVALEIIGSEARSLDACIAHGVLKVFINQQEKLKSDEKV